MIEKIDVRVPVGIPFDMLGYAVALTAAFIATRSTSVDEPSMSCSAEGAEAGGGW